MKTNFTFRNTGIALLVMFFLSLNFNAFGQSTEPKVENKQVDAQKTLVIKTSVASADVGKSMGELFGKLFGYLGANNIQPVGPPFAVYYEYDPNGNTTFEVGVPVAAAVKGSADVVYKEFPAMKVLSTLHIGPYEKVAPVYEFLMKFAKDKNIEVAGTAWEVYLTDPSKETDPNKYQTLIYFPLK